MNAEKTPPQAGTATGSLRGSGKGSMREEASSSQKGVQTSSRPTAEKAMDSNITTDEAYLLSVDRSSNLNEIWGLFERGKDIAELKESSDDSDGDGDGDDAYLTDEEETDRIRRGKEKHKLMYSSKGGDKAKASAKHHQKASELSSTKEDNPLPHKQSSKGDTIVKEGSDNPPPLYSIFSLFAGTNNNPSKQPYMDSSNKRIGVLTISYIRCKNLHTSPPSLIGLLQAPTLKSFVVCSVKDVHKHTTAVKGRNDPQFPNTFNFIIHDPMYEELNLKVMDKVRLLFWYSN